MKKILIFIALWLCFCTSTYAANTDGDCALILSKDKILSNWNDGTQWNLVQAMPKEAMEKAFDNLNAYCCDVNKITDTCIDTNNNTFYPESLFIFDHILDIYLRRLDAKQENENWEDLLYGLEPDSIWKEWRDFIIARGNDTKWTLPLQIRGKYENFWTTTKNVPVLSENYQQYIQNRKSSISGNIQTYDSRTLQDKYNLACDITKYIVEILGANDIDSPQYQSCKNLTNNRINNENKYVKTILLQQSNKLLSSNIKSYTNIYFVSNKLNDLQSVIVNINTSLFEINKAVQKLTPECS